MTDELKPVDEVQKACEEAADKVIQMVAPVSKECTHEAFASNFRIVKAVATDKNNELQHVAELSISCSQCKKPFQFQCPRYGINWDDTTRSLDGTMLYVPIKPSELKTFGDKR